MPSHLLIDSSDVERLQQVWGLNVQPSSLQVHTAGFRAAISGIAIGGSSVYCTQVSGSYSLQTTKISGDFILAALVDGCGRIRWAGKEGEWFNLEPGHVVLAIPGTDCEYDMSNTLAVTIGIRPRNADLMQMKALPYRIRNKIVGVLREPDSCDLFHLMLFITSEIERCGDRPGGGLDYIQVLLDALASRFSIYLRRMLGPERAYSAQDLAIALRCDEIIIRSDCSISCVKDLAKEAGWSERHVYRAFDEVCGCTPSEFMKRVRLFMARSRLKFPPTVSQSMSEVASKAGYGTLRAFRRDYLNEFGEEC